jgi:hypothetical protein
MGWEWVGNSWGMGGDTGVMGGGTDTTSMIHDGVTGERSWACGPA